MDNFVFVQFCEVSSQCQCTNTLTAHFCYSNWVIHFCLNNPAIFNVSTSFSAALLDSVQPQSYCIKVMEVDSTQLQSDAMWHLDIIATVHSLIYIHTIQTKMHCMKTMVQRLFHAIMKKHIKCIKIYHGVSRTIKKILREASSQQILKSISAIPCIGV